MQKYRRILVSAFLNIGDALLATSAIALLRQSSPRAEIAVIVKPAAQDLFRGNPLVNEAIVFSYRRGVLSLTETIGLVKTIRSRGFDLFVSLDRKPRLIWAALLAGIPVRVGPDRGIGDSDKPDWVNSLFTHVSRMPADYTAHHQSENFQTIVRRFTGTNMAASPVRPPVTEEHRAKAGRLISRLPPHSRRIALCVKGTNVLKDWPLEKFAAVLESLHRDYDAAFFIVGAAADRPYADRLAGLTPVRPANFCGETGLLDLAALLERADLFLTIDTGAMHIAATTSIPIAAIFLLDWTDRYSPLSDKAVALARTLSLYPWPAPARQYPEEVRPEGISVERVLEAARFLLEENLSDGPRNHQCAYQDDHSAAGR